MGNWCLFELLITNKKALHVPMNRNHVTEVWRTNMYPFMLPACQQLNLSTYDARTKARSVALTVTVKNGLPTVTKRLTGCEKANPLFRQNANQ